LIEVMVAVVLIAVCLLGMVQFFASAGDRVMDSETRSLLHQIAAQEIEDIRALPYEDIGTIAGQPSGLIPDVETRTVEGVPVEITREVIYVQDPSYSGPYPANYRRVTVAVRATDSEELAPMQLSTIVAGGADGGTLDITVTDLAGQPVRDVRLQIVNDNLVPRVDIQSSAMRTDVQGHLLVPGLVPDDTNGYYVTATKTGHNDAATSEGLVVDRGTPFTVVQLIVDELSSLSVRLTDGTGVPQADVMLVVGGHISVEPWIFTRQATTNDEGEAFFGDLRYATSLQPLVLQTVDQYEALLQLPLGTDSDPVDSGILLEPGQVGLILEPGTDRFLELELPARPAEP